MVPALSLSISFAGHKQVYYEETTLNITEVKKEDLQSNFTCIALNIMYNTRVTVTLQLKVKSEGRIFSFWFLHFTLSLIYLGEFILLFVSDSKKVSVNKKQNQPASSLYVQASCKILMAESLELGREGNIIQTVSARD